MNQVAKPNRPRPGVAPPARPRPVAPPSIAQTAAQVQPRETLLDGLDATPARGFEPTGLSAPKPPPGIIAWQNGSAVFAAGFAGRERAWAKPVEFHEGFMGRLHHEGNGEVAAYVWVKSVKAYRFAGRRKTHNEAMTLL